MRKIIITLLLLVASSGAMAEWTMVAGDAHGSYDAYVDFSTISKTGTTVKMWRLLNYKNTQVSGKVSYLSNAIQNEYDCKEGQSRVLAIVEFSGKMSSGNVVLGVDVSGLSARSLAKSNSVGKSLLDIACGTQYVSAE
jgi:hypothetical protein